MTYTVDNYCYVCILQHSVVRLNIAEIRHFQGDSGGPLVCKDSRGVFTLAGAAAFVLGREDEPCLSVSVYTYVVPFINWITATMQNN